MPVGSTPCNGGELSQQDSNLPVLLWFGVGRHPCFEHAHQIWRKHQDVSHSQRKQTKVLQMIMSSNGPDAASQAV